MPTYLDLDGCSEDVGRSLPGTNTEETRTPEQMSPSSVLRVTADSDASEDASTITRRRTKPEDGADVARQSTSWSRGSSRPKLQKSQTVIHTDIGHSYLHRADSRFHRWEHDYVKLPSQCTYLSNSEVALGFHVLHMGTIDTVQSTFTIELMLFMVWRDESLQHKIAGWPTVNVDPETIFVPQYIVVNAVGAPEKTATRVCAHDRNNPACELVRLQEKISVTCHEVLELRSFPCDMQELTVTFYFPFLFSKDRSMDPHVTALNVEREAPHPVEGWHEVALGVDDQAARHPGGHDLLQALRGAQTDPGAPPHLPHRALAEFYLINFALTAGLMTTLAQGVSLLKYEDLGNRLAVGFTVVLTASAFKLLVADLLPKVPYFTLLDQYMFACVMFLLVLVLISIIQTQLLAGGALTHHIGQVNAAFNIAWGALWALYNLTFLLQIVRARRANNRDFPVVAYPDHQVVQSNVAGGAFYRCKLANHKDEEDDEDDLSCY
eukprot:CAMPEP_0197918824 /NCGR_PEP_ID=MMETSP1439-20131203/86149_1 /TAXON_ID=66791 /ORGANISM="Gonyaulax spinifera, Strain CCMP409" /LENGTH=492 /DNA_ID=CAMNT_0043540959 /DNA_START=40 /DNA_END=1518 /DNA_ORIENTATION=-